MLLVFGAIIGVPVAAAAYFFLEGFTRLQHYLYGTLPGDLGFDSQPVWWPIPLLALSGLLVALTIRHLPGTAGHKPAEGFKASGPVPPIELPGIVIASFATLSLGVVLGPEAPLIAIGSGLGVLAVHLVKRDAPEMASVVIGAAGSFAAISTLLGSPLPAAFLMMEVAGIGGAMLGVVLAPGLLAAGVGSLIFIGLDNWTGFGTFSLAVPNIPPAGSPRVAEFLWAIVIGVVAAILGAGIKRLARLLQPIVERRMVLLTPVVGVAIGVVVLIFVEVTGRSSAEVLFSGQDQLPGLIEGAAGWTVGALLMVVLCKGLAYSFSLSSFRGGPIFPSMFIGAAGGIALSHLPGLPMIAGAAMGIGATMVAMLGLPLTSVLIVSVFLEADGLTLMPLVIVAVVVSYVVSARLPSARGSAAIVGKLRRERAARQPAEAARGLSRGGLGQGERHHGRELGEERGHRVEQRVGQEERAPRDDHPHAAQPPAGEDEPDHANRHRHRPTAPLQQPRGRVGPDALEERLPLRALRPRLELVLSRGSCPIVDGPDPEPVAAPCNRRADERDLHEIAGEEDDERQDRSERHEPAVPGPTLAGADGALDSRPRHGDEPHTAARAPHRSLWMKRGGSPPSRLPGTA